MISLQEKSLLFFAILETVHEGQRIIYCDHSCFYLEIKKK